MEEKKRLHILLPAYIHRKAKIKALLEEKTLTEYIIELMLKNFAESEKDEQK